MARSSKDEGDQTTIIIIIVVIAIVIGLAAVAAVIFCHMRKRRSKADEADVLGESTSAKDAGGAGDEYSMANAWFPDYKQDCTTSTCTVKNSVLEVDEKL